MFELLTATTKAVDLSLSSVLEFVLPVVVK